MKLTPKEFKITALWIASIVIHSCMIASGMLAAKLMFDLNIPIVSTSIFLIGYAMGNFTRGDATTIANDEGVKDGE